jgi:spore germination protein
MVQRFRIASESGLRRLSILPRPVIVVGYLLLFVLWTLLVSDTIAIWQQRQVVVEERRLHAALMPPTPTATPQPTPTATGTPQPTAPVIAAVPVPATPTARPIAAVHPKTGRSIAAWLPTSFDAERARASFDANKDILDEVSPFWYTTRIENGALIPDIGARDRELVAAARAADVLVMPTIHNVMAPEAIVPLLRDPNRRKEHIAAIMAEIRAYEYDGIDIDYESLPANSREPYSAFMQELSTALRAEGKLLTVAVHAKTDDWGGLGGFQDWKLLGEICDRVRIMTYDFHWRGGGPGPIAPMNWVAAVGEYARAVVPAEKLQVGIPFYGYNWGEGEDAVAQTWTDIQRLIEVYQPDVNLAARDSSGPIEESWFTYRRNGQRRTVWFADHRSLQAKLNLVEQLDLAGIAIWRLGNEDPQNWEVVRKELVENPSVLQRVVNSYLPDH